jgi:hypothetical protein
LLQPPREIATIRANFERDYRSITEQPVPDINAKQALAGTPAAPSRFLCAAGQRTGILIQITSLVIASKSTLALISLASLRVLGGSNAGFRFIQLPAT